MEKEHKYTFKELLELCEAYVKAKSVAEKANVENEELLSLLLAVRPRENKKIKIIS